MGQKWAETDRNGRKENEKDQYLSRPILEMRECYQTTQMEAFFWNASVMNGFGSHHHVRCALRALVCLSAAAIHMISLQIPIINCASASNPFQSTVIFYQSRIPYFLCKAHWTKNEQNVKYDKSHQKRNETKKPRNHAIRIAQSNKKEKYHAKYSQWQPAMAITTTATITQQYSCLAYVHL